MYQVFDNNAPAFWVRRNVRGLRDNSSFDDLEAALEYADKWLGANSPGIEVLRVEAVGKAYDYNGYGDVIEIRQV